MARVRYLLAVMPLEGGLGGLFGVSVNPVAIRGRGADYVHRITACQSGFKNLTESLHCLESLPKTYEVCM